MIVKGDLTINLIVFVHQPALNRRTRSERPRPCKHIPRSHGLSEIGEDADVPWEFLVFDVDFGAVGAVELAT